MRIKHVILSLVAVGYSALDSFTVYTHGVDGFTALSTDNLVAFSLLMNVTIALLVVAMWVVQDLINRGESPWRALPYVGVGLVFGCVAPILYTLSRERADRDEGSPGFAPLLTPRGTSGT